MAALSALSFGASKEICSFWNHTIPNGGNTSRVLTRHKPTFVTPRAQHEDGSISDASKQREHLQQIAERPRRVQTILVAAAMAFTQIFSPLTVSSTGGDAVNVPAALVPGVAQPAEAILFSPDTKIPRNADVALRRSIPTQNPEIKTIQDKLEEIYLLLRIPQRKPYGTMERNVKNAITVATEKKASILAAVPETERANAEDLLENFLTGKSGLEGVLAAIQVQDPEKTALRLQSSLDTLAQLKLAQAPGLPFLLPPQYAKLPRLTGRATAQLTFLKADGSSFRTENGSGSVPSATVDIVLDGFSAPLTTGNFSTLLLKGAYDGVALQATSQAVIAEAREERLGTELPLEVMPSGDFQPVYRTPLDVQDGELPVLPLSVYGSVAMSHSVSSDMSSHPSQFFFFLYDKRNSGLGGLSFDEGQFSVFGYVTKGKEILSQLRTGDVIETGRIVAGFDRLVLPPASAAAADETSLSVTP
eukprot:TRINITY_DN1814_c0_g1_i1.p1 TRINITY_DN1814_c0_g1~~TRINITY_DN1814_c0_g1_i1.p1  ORF type:complete len:475 (+),score=109.48 TRINITY_DN1814_c0_g1_i1:50-1474(+)